MLPLGCVAFLLFGVVLVLLGACQEGLSRSLALDHAAFGLLGSALAAGIGAGVLVAGPLIDRHPRRPLFFVAALIAAAALLGVSPAMRFERALVHVAIIGFGTGIHDTLINAVTVERWRERSIRPMTFLHAMVTLGAIATPQLVEIAGGADRWVDVFHAAGLAYLALALWIAWVPLPAPDRSHPLAREGRPHGTRRAPFLQPGFLALCAVAFAYVGVEAVLTLFAVPYADEVLHQGALHGRNAISAFWSGILIGRIALMAPIGTHADARALVASGLGAGLLLGAGSVLRFTPLELLLGIVGVALAGVFPIMIALAGQRVPQARGLATGLVAGAGSVGGFVLPWLTGMIADRQGMAAAMASTAVWCTLIGVTGWVAHRTRASAGAALAAQARIAAAPAVTDAAAGGSDGA